MTKVSFFKNVGDTKPKTIDLEEWLKRTMDPTDKSVAKVLKYRLTKKQEHKTSIPCITVSASFKKYRNLDNIKEKNNLICLDIDRYSKSKKKPSNVCVDMERVKEFFSSHPCCLYAGYSTGGDGIYAIIRLKYSNKLDEYFQHFQKKLALIGLNIDSSCKDYARLRFFSHDLTAYYNPDAKYYNIKKDIPEKRTKSTNKVNKSDLEKIEKIISLIEQHNIDITSNYEDWIKIGAALHNSFGENGRDYFHRISKLYPDYKFKDADRKFTNCKKLKKTGLGSLFFIANDHGIRY